MTERSLVQGRKVRLAWVPAIVFVTSAVIVQTPTLSPSWTGTHWLFSYEFGFLKRGLVGTLVTPVVPLTTFADLVAVSLVTSLITFTAFFWWILLPAWRTGLSLYLSLWVAFAVLHSGTLQNLWFDPLRFDQINLWLLLLTLATIARTGPKTSTAAVGVLGILSLLVHEAAFFTTLPVMLGALAFRLSSTATPRPWRWMGALAVLFTLVTFLIGTLGRLRMTCEKYLEHLQSIVEFEVAPRSVAVLTRSLDENMAMTLAHLGRGTVIQGHLVLALLLVPTGVVCVGLVRDLRAQVRPTLPGVTYPFLAASLSPLALYGLGLDFFRWWALATLNFFVAVAWLCRVRPDCVQTVEASVRSRWVWVVVVIGLSLVLGPMGVYFGFPHSIWADSGLPLLNTRQ